MSDKSYDLYVRIEDEFDKNPYQDFNDRKLLALDHQQLHDILQYWLATGANSGRDYRLKAIIRRLLP